MAAMRPYTHLLVLAIATGALTACGGDDEPAADCIDATDYAPAIARGTSGSKITPGDAQAVKSDTSDVYYVAMDFTIDGDTETGVWITTTLDPDAAGSILSASAMAATVTKWPDAATQDISYPNDNTEAAEACLD